MPPIEVVSKMLHADLEAAGIPVETDSGRVDFHALRVTCLSWLANEAGVPVKVLQDFARHSTPTLTMSLYARTLRGSLVGAADRLPDLRGAGDQRQATGTDERPAPNTAPNRLHSQGPACIDLRDETGEVPTDGTKNQVSGVGKKGL